MTPTLGGSINQTFLSIYDQTVQAALNSGSGVYVIVDLVGDVENQVQPEFNSTLSTTTLVGTARYE